MQLICLFSVLPFMLKPLMLTFLNLPSPLKMRASKTSPSPQWNLTRKKNFRFSSIYSRNDPDNLKSKRTLKKKQNNPTN